MAIQVFQPKFDIDACLKEVRECLEKGWTGIGYKTVEFEKQWKEYTGVKNAFFVNSATAALNLACDIFKEEYGWDDESEVITTPLTFISTNHAILLAGLKPVFADVDDTLCLDPKDILKKITPKTKAVMYVGLGGNAGHLDEVIKICKDHDLKLMLDAAHMAGTRYKGEVIGPQADVTIFSFQAVKNLPTGDSGMVCFTEEKFDQIARKKAWLGINKDTYMRSEDGGSYKWRYDVEYVGNKYHGNAIMGALALAQLPHLDEDNEYRRKVCSWYEEELKDLIPEKIGLVTIPEDCISSRHIFQIIVDNRDALVTYLNEHDINPGVHYVDNTEYRMYKYADGTCPRAREYSKKVISLPAHLNISRDDVKYISDVVKEFLR